jgi:hypothetical protein
MSETGVGASTTAKGACLYDEMGNCIAAAATSRREAGFSPSGEGETFARRCRPPSRWRRPVSGSTSEQGAPALAAPTWTR